MEEEKFELTCSQCGTVMRFQKRQHYMRVKNGYRLCNSCRVKQYQKKRDEKRKQNQQHDFELPCSKCGEIIHFHRQCDFTRAKNSNNVICDKCKHERHGKPIVTKTCVVCGKEFQGISIRKFCDECLKNCPSGRFKYNKEKNCWIPQLTRKEYKEKIKNGEIKNGMTGRSVYSVWVDKYGEEEANKKLEDFKNKSHQTWNNLSDEEKHKRNAKKASHGERNGMFGKTFYDVWVEKYGEEEADRRLIELKQKKSEQSKGKNNPMYGKSAPKGSGNGISGWYKDWYFRSLRELSYMINVIEKEGHKWRSLDNTSDFRIKYIDSNGHERSYCPDFLIDDKIVVEIKPKQLQELDCILKKENAAILFCKSRNLDYIKIDVKIMDFNIIQNMIDNKIVKLTEKSLNKFNKYQHKHYKGKCKDENQRGN